MIAMETQWQRRNQRKIKTACGVPCRMPFLYFKLFLLILIAQGPLHQFVRHVLQQQGILGDAVQVQTGV